MPRSNWQGEGLLDDEDFQQETYVQGALERLIKRHYGRLQADADRRHRETMAAIQALAEAAIGDPAKLATLKEGLAKLAKRVETVTASDRKLQQP